MIDRQHQPREWDNTTNDPHYDDQGYFPSAGDEHDSYSDADNGFPTPYSHSFAAESYDDASDPQNHPQSRYDGRDETHGYEYDQNIEQPSESGIQFYTDDFVDLKHSAGPVQFGKTATIIAATLVVSALAIGIMRSSQPELSPLDIVQLETYEGLQESRNIFNLARLQGCETPADCIRNIRSVTRPGNTAATPETNAPLEIPASLKTGVTHIPSQTPAPAASNQPVVSSTISDSQQQIVSSTLPTTMVVQKQWSIIRSNPDANGGIITSLAKGKVVDILAADGVWYEIQANNHARTRGFMHRSTLSP